MIPLWTPSKAQVAQANITKFAQYLGAQLSIDLESYSQLHRFSVDHPDVFWKAIWDYFNVQGTDEAERILLNKNDIEHARWFEGATLNFAEKLLLKGEDQQIALVERGEDGRRRTFTFAELKSQVSRIADGLRKQGVVAGDRVAGFLPNCAEAVTAMLATASLGAIWSSCSPDFGLQGVIDRFGQIEPKVLFATNGYQYAGKVISTLDRVKDISAHLPSLNALVLIPYIQQGCQAFESVQVALSDVAYFEWDHFGIAGTLEFKPMPFSAPLYILYSSGTTGVPKCIVHSAGGTLLQHIKELGLHTNLKAGERLFFYSTCGWMMWNWLASGLALGATLVLYDGSPFYPSPAALFDIAEQEEITHFGGGAKYYSACEKAALSPKKTHKLESLKTILSTGSPLSHESFDYIYKHIKSDLCLASISGGTDIVSCFVLGNPVLPVYKGEIQCAGLGMNVQIFDDDGRPISSGKGELVCCTPFPSCPIGFWRDDGSKFHDAYFSRFPGVWAHGDYAEFAKHSEDGHLGFIIHGRSDAVLNPGGVRIGTAEIYRQVEKVDEVLESIAIGQPWNNDVRVVLFVKLRPGVQLDELLIEKIKNTIRSNTTPRHVPAKILEVNDIPRTISGKIVELAVRNAVQGLPVKNTDALANPEALDAFRHRSELSC
ncbi:MAG: acetoacetate--CoA ligase [Hahellaceae bacterium]|nr:acetoacetate--CoA ligase [Hahellaceae bacterium]MCP5170417.1 acetoacetate--CoA ligase [Hahellaceae bacterium]